MEPRLEAVGPAAHDDLCPVESLGLGTVVHGIEDLVQSFAGIKKRLTGPSGDWYRLVRAQQEETIFARRSD